MKQWSIAAIEQEPSYLKDRTDQLAEYLEDGWEPFAVTEEGRNYFGNDVSVYVYHLKKKIIKTK